ncbi:CRTAC1 family protein, partial [bacterium]
CLLPIRGSGIHVLQRGSRRAFQEYLALLEEHPENVEYRWLLNLAAMTLGEYPDKVPARWVVPPASFESEYPLPRFTDLAPGLGLDRLGLAGGAIVDDLNGDGHLDVLTSSWGLLDPIRYFQNNADGTFTDRTAAAGLTGVTGGLHLAQADYDNDGDLDVAVPRGAWVGVAGQGNHPNSLLRNNGDGSFEDVTEEAGLLSLHPTQAVAWGDYDNDGWLDLFIGNESTGKPEHPSELYRNNGDGTFTDVAAEAGVAAPGFVKGATWGDYDNDGRLDLYLSRFGQKNVLYRNLGPAAAAEGEAAGGRRPWRFADVTTEAGVAEPLKSFATWFWDYDNDGWLDLFVAPFLGFVGRNQATVAAEYLGLPAQGEQPRLYRNRGDGTFEDVTRAVRLARPMLVMGSNFGDLDNDGFLDLYLATGEPNLGTLVPNRMFRNDNGRTFQDVTTAGGFGHLQKGHAIAFADIDNDGDQDVYAVMGGAYSGDRYWNALFQNPGSGNHWITLRLEGVESNRSAAGARLRLVVETGDGAERTIHATVGATGSFGSSSLQQEIGLGKARALRSVEVTWPRTGKVQVFRNLAMDRVFKIREGSPGPVPVELKRLDLSAAARPHRHQD